MMEHNWTITLAGNCSDISIATDWNDTGILEIPPCNDVSVQSAGGKLHKYTMGQIEMVLQIVFLVIGLLGNITTVILMRKKHWMGASSRIILTALAISDTLMIITHTFNQKFIFKAVGMDLRGLSMIGCKIFFIVYRTSKMTSSWFIVFLCFERFIAITWPLKMSDIITVRRVKLCVIVNYTVFICFNIILSFSTAVKGGVCEKNDPRIFGRSALQPLAITEMLVYSVLPITINLLLTPVTVIKLIKYYKKKQNLHGQSNEEKARIQRQLQELVRTTVTLITVQLTFIVTVIPIAIVQIRSIQQNQTYKDDDDLFKFIAKRLEQVNYSINFFLYLLTSSKFRQHFITYFGSCCCLRRRT